MCGVGEQVRKKQQRLLKNMDAHKVMLDLLQIPYEKVGDRSQLVSKCMEQRVGTWGHPTWLSPAAGQPAPLLHLSPTLSVCPLCLSSG